MKKIILSFIVIITFLAYCFHEQTEKSEVTVTPPSLPPTTPAQGNTMTSKFSYKDGEYTGEVADAFYGNIQVKTIIRGGKITDIQFLEYPHDRSTSIQINTQAMPLLKQEAIAAQTYEVDIVSGATESSAAFRQSLQSALNKAKS